MILLMILKTVFIERVKRILTSGSINNYLGTKFV